MHRLRRTGPAGFTLVELLIVVAVLAITASVAIPLLHSSLAEADVTAATDEIVAALDHARRASLRSVHACRVVFDVAADTLAVQRAALPAVVFDVTATSLLPSAVVLGAQQSIQHPLKPGIAYRVDLASERHGGVDIVAVSFGGASWVSFNANGIPSQAGSVSVARGNAAAVVTVDARGRLKVTP